MLAAIVASSDDAIVSKDLSGIITSWNRGAERIFGYTAEEAVGRSITMLLPAERLDEEQRILSTLTRGERIDHFETERVTKQGKRIHVSVSVSPLKDSTGRVVGGAKIARDITSRTMMQREREDILRKERDARALAEAASRSKDAFLAMVSHELRSPLSPILAWARMLRQGLLDDAKMAQAVQIIERNALAQAQLIDDLLDISRIVAGKLRLEVQSVDLLAIIHHALDSIRPTADAKAIRLAAVLDSETGRITGDPARLHQVLWNLLSNAVKFTEKGGRVQVTLERVNSHVEVSVHDTGRGIASDFLPLLFQRFQQAESGSSRTYGGLGLGLSIVRHIVELHGGTVTATSPGEGMGASFTVRLPRVSLAAPADGPDRRHPTIGSLPELTERTSLSGLRVLVVDDEPDSNDVVSAVLTYAGAEVRVGGSAAQGLDQLREWLPQVIVSDIGMPNVDGYAFLSEIRAQPGELGRIPAVALTAYATTDDRIRIFSAGFQAHIVKPVDPGELLAVVAGVAKLVIPSRN
jgi:PAS domain S-box-containing protein